MLESIPVSCFRPQIVVNPRYRGYPCDPRAFFNALDFPEDFRENYYLKVPCCTCFLCRKKRGSAWRVRLFEECRKYTPIVVNGESVLPVVFVTFTYAEEPKSEMRSVLADDIRRWRDRWRKRYGSSPRYFATSDKGHKFGRVHFHLLLFDPRRRDGSSISIDDLNDVNFCWKHGFAMEPSYLRSERGITYVTGYVSGSNLQKEALKHGEPICKEAKEYYPYVFVSNGLGNTDIRESPNFVFDTHSNRYFYRIKGFDYALPAYYRYKLFDWWERWHQNVIYKYEYQHYISTASSLWFSLHSARLSYQQVCDMYKDYYMQFDDDNHKYLRLDV